MTEGKELTVTTTEAIVALLPKLEEVRGIVAQTLAGGAVSEFQLDRVHVPGAGGTTWSVPSLEGEATETKAIEGVIVGSKHTRAYWAKSYNAANPSPPDCASNDAVTGYGDRGEAGSGPQDCYNCPLAEWGTKGDGRRSQSCKSMIQLFILTPGSLLPLVLSVPPSSLKTVEPYTLRLLGQGIPKWGAVTRFTLEKKEIGGYPTAVVKPTLAGRLTKEQTDAMFQYCLALAPLVRQSPVIDVEVVDPE